MSQRCILPYGSRPIDVEFPDFIEPTVVMPPRSGAPQPLSDVLARALDAPIGMPRLERAVAPGSRVVIIVSDATRDDPRSALVDALLARLPTDIRLTIAIANGTHGRSDLSRLGLRPDICSRATIVNHDAHDETDLVTIGETRRGTPVRIHRCVIDADWVVATGRIKPHYFAGYGAGCKAIFPGLGGNREIRINHRLKCQPGSRAGVVVGNPCRDDLEEAVSMVPARRFLLNLVLDATGGVQDAVAGDIVQAFGVGAARCEPLFVVHAPRSRLVVVSDELPLTASLYQASKLVAAAAPLLLPGGMMIVVAACPEGTGPLETVNKAIYDIGIAPRLPAEHRIVLISEIPQPRVEASYCEWAPSVAAAIERYMSNIEQATVLPQAGSLIVRPMTTTRGGSA